MQRRNSKLQSIISHSTSIHSNKQLSEHQINQFNQLQILRANRQLNITRINNLCSWNHVEPRETLVKPSPLTRDNVDPRSRRVSSDSTNGQFLPVAVRNGPTLPPHTGKSDLITESRAAASGLIH